MKISALILMCLSLSFFSASAHSAAANPGKKKINLSESCKSFVQQNHNKSEKDVKDSDIKLFKKACGDLSLQREINCNVHNVSSFCFCMADLVSLLGH